MYTMQVKIETEHNKWEWKDVHPTNGPAYTFATEKEALDMLNMCYPEEIYGEEVRVHKSNL